MISVTMVAKVGEETILETALVSLLPDFEVEVGAKLIFTLLTVTSRRSLRSAAWRRPPTGRLSSTGTCCCFRRFSYLDLCCTMYSQDY